MPHHADLLRVIHGIGIIIVFQAYSYRIVAASPVVRGLKGDRGILIIGIIVYYPAAADLDIQAFIPDGPESPEFR